MSQAKRNDSINSPIDQRKIPNAVVKRLSLYSRALHQLESERAEKVSSTKLGEMLGINSAQVRKDLAYFGQFGVPGFGYPVRQLRENLKRILGTDREIRVALVGAGNLGRALLSYGGFRREGFKIECGFDKALQETAESESGIPIYPIEELERRIEELQIDFAILSVPNEAAQGLTDRLVGLGVSGILNFVPIRLSVPDHVQVHNVDLALEMESLAYFLT